MSRAEKIASDLATVVMLESQWAGKSAGSLEYLESAFLPGAKLIAKLEKKISSTAARIRKQDQQWRDTTARLN